MDDKVRPVNRAKTRVDLGVVNLMRKSGNSVQVGHLRQFEG